MSFPSNFNVKGITDANNKQTSNTDPLVCSAWY